jgi:hypothetical protein
VSSPTPEPSMIVMRSEPSGSLAELQFRFGMQMKTLKK